MGTSTFDIFLSRNYRDKAAVATARAELEALGYSVYVDWMDDPDWDRSRVTAKTVDGLRMRMRKCRCLFFAVSRNSRRSKWTPWELGYMDGCNGTVFVFPLSSDVEQGSTGQEYLDAYPLVDRARLRDFLAKHLPKTGNPVFDNPIFPPAHQMATADYGDWMRNNAARLSTDPAAMMKWWSDTWEAYLRLWVK